MNLFSTLIDREDMVDSLIQGVRSIFGSIMEIMNFSGGAGTGIHISGIENFWSYTKRHLSKFNGVKVNFHLHLKEYTKETVELEKELTTMIKSFYKKPRKS